MGITTERLTLIGIYLLVGLLNATCIGGLLVLFSGFSLDVIRSAILVLTPLGALTVMGVCAFLHNSREIEPPAPADPATH